MIETNNAQKNEKRILAVDDEILNLELLSHMLYNSNYN